MADKDTEKNPQTADLKPDRAIDATVGSPVGPVAGEGAEDVEHPDRKCPKCGAVFSGEGAVRAYREHRASFHPSED